MKIIDLLNKIANGEEVPKKIRIKQRNDSIYEYKPINNTNLYHYFNIDTHERLGSDWRLDGSMLNDVIEILEEEKKEIKPLTKKDIEALGYACGEIQKCFTNGWTKSLENKSLEEEKKIPEKLKILPDNEQYSNKILYGKINEIIDYLKSKGE